MMKICGYFNRPKVEGIKFVEPSMCQQQFADECDLNNIVDHNLRFKDPAFVTKLMLSGKMSDKQPIYGDFTQVKDYQTSLNIVNEAREQFDALPAKVRDRFENDPAKMLAFCNAAVTDDSIYNEGVTLGLFEQKPFSIEKSSNVNENPTVAGTEPSVTVSDTVSETSTQ